MFTINLLYGKSCSILSFGNIYYQKVFVASLKVNAWFRKIDLWQIVYQKPESKKDDTKRNFVKDECIEVETYSVETRV